MDLVVRDTGTTAIQRLRDHADPRRGHGLRITRRLARLNGGELRVRGGGGGTVAALVLPLAPARPSRSAPRTAGEEQGPRRRLRLRRVRMCAGLSAAVAGSSEAPEAGFGSLRPVVVTSAPLERATTVGRKELRDALAERRVPEAFVPPDALGIPEEALGRKLAVPLPAGSYLTAAAFKAPSEGPGPRGGPPTGTTPVEITVTGAGALAATKTDQGDQVDVVVSGDAAPGPGAGRTYVAASDVSLLALREARAEPGLEADRWIATLALTREEALRLIRAESVGAQVRLLADHASALALDGEPRDAEVHPAAAERDALGFEQGALALADGERAVGADDAMPGDALVLARGHHRAGASWRLGAEVAVGRDEALGDRARAVEDLVIVVS